MRISSKVKQYTNGKRKYARLMDDIKTVTDQFKHTRFYVDLEKDIETGEPILVIKALESDQSWKQLTKALSEALLPISSKGIEQYGLTVIPSVEFESRDAT